MKKSLQVLLAALLLTMFSHCANDEFTEPMPPADDPPTMANAYQDQFLTLKITTNTTSRGVLFNLEGNGGKVSINWGDGTIEKKVLGVNQYVQFMHLYDREKNYTINVSGEINTIVGFEWAEGEAVEVNNIHFGGMVNLRRINMNLVEKGPFEINLSKNRLLESVNLFGVERTKDIILPTTHNINNINIGGPNDLPTAIVDRVIARIHDSVVNNPRPGFIALDKIWTGQDSGTSMVGPPSSYSVTKLQKLRTKYGWTVSPNIN